MYNAYVVKINELHKHPNADKLQIAKVFGLSVIVGQDVHEGDIMIYFPSDGQLNKEFAEYCNLLRKKDENGNNIGGYMDERKCNVKAIKLRGEYSDGLLIPIHKLTEFLKLDKDYFEVGNVVNTVDGVEICKKYVPQRNNKTESMLKTKKKNNKDKYPLFHEHIDTKQLAYNYGELMDGDRLTVSLKLHGCFTSDTRIKTTKNRATRISKIKVGDKVLGVDKDGKIVETKVLNTFINGKATEWINLKTTRKGCAGESQTSVRVTPDHCYLCSDRKTYKPIKDFNIGDTVLSVKKTKILTEDQKSILIGKALGDGYVAFFETTSELHFSHAEKYRDYLEYNIKSLGDIAYKVDKEYISGYGTEMVRAKTSRELSIYNLFKDIINTKKGLDVNENRLKKEIVDYFDEISLAFLYMDDGSLSHSDFQKDRANFAICSYTTQHDINIILKCFNKLGLNPIYYKDYKGYSRLRLNTVEAYKMFDMIEKYIPNSQRYKLPQEYRYDVEDYDFNNKSINGYDYVENTIVKKEYCKAKRGYNKYDIETETHNYIAGECIVHNSSQRTSNTKLIEKQGLFKRIINAINNKYSEYKTVSGTRRVVLDNFDGGYYGSNEFRKKYHDLFDGKLYKGETVYYEIVGYTESGQLIMPQCDNKKLNDKEFIKKYGETTSFTYGCSDGESDIYVYRMSMTNEDGVEIDYSTEYTMLRCEQMGVKHVPVIKTIDNFSVDDIDEFRNYINEISDGADLIDPTHIREGVVVRVENRLEFAAYKHKSMDFKILEGIIKENATSPDMEEQEG